MSGHKTNFRFLIQIENGPVIRRMRKQFKIYLDTDGEMTLLVMYLIKKNGRRFYPIIIYGDKNAKTPIENAAEEVAIAWNIKTDCEE